ncbi:hypothetical protein HAX54_044417 [Datura stramonium]|uniref:Putative plant transposon protein domain-containing protein n=1 Tax=Datura stramonium TaxID=4076 RepID=A0ABS8WII1_DATST|nr:hypothetical protein [Datura stramonium]
MPPKFQPTRGGAQRRNDRTETTHHLKDENTDSEKEIEEIGIEEPSLAYQARSVAIQQAATPQSDEGDDSLAKGSSLDGASSNANEKSGNEATSSPAGDSKPLRGDVLKAKMLRFRDSISREGLTTTVRGHLKRSIAEEVRIIDSELAEYPDIERQYKFYGLGWISESTGYYQPNMVHEFYKNYVSTLEGQCKKGQNPAEMHFLLCVRVREEMVDISIATINRMMYGPDFMRPASTTEFDYRMRERHNLHRWLAQVLIDGQPSWLTNTKERIVKSTSIVAAKFWWVVVQL